MRISFIPRGPLLRILSEYLEPDKRFDQNKINSTVLFLGSARIRGRRTANRAARPVLPGGRRIGLPARPLGDPLAAEGKKFRDLHGRRVRGSWKRPTRGAARAGGKTIGMNISLPQEQLPIPTSPDDLGFLFHYFFMRKFWLVSRARAVIAFPGGYGTLDELFETLTLIQTEKIAREEVVGLVVRGGVLERRLPYRRPGQKQGDFARATRRFSPMLRIRIKPSPSLRESC